MTTYATPPRSANVADRAIFWAVTSATEHSTIGDICFQVSPRGLVLQGLGGLRDQPYTPTGAFERPAHHLVAVYTSQSQALKHAKHLIAVAQAAKAVV